jgi:hypothetical protein
MPVLHPRRQTHDCSFDQIHLFLNANTLIDTTELTTAMGDCLSMFEITRLNLIQVFFGGVNKKRLSCTVSLLVSLVDESESYGCVSLVRNSFGRVVYMMHK